MGKQERLLSGSARRGEASALHKDASVFGTGRASPPPVPLLPSDLHLPEELASPQRYEPARLSGILPALFYLSLQFPCPELGRFCARAFQLLLLLRPEVSSLILYVPPFTPAISTDRAC